MVDIEIKKDGHKVVQPYAPVTELRILETIHRKGFTPCKWQNDWV